MFKVFSNLFLKTNPYQSNGATPLTKQRPQWRDKNPNHHDINMPYLKVTGLTRLSPGMYASLKRDANTVNSIAEGHGFKIIGRFIFGGSPLNDGIKFRFKGRKHPKPVTLEYVNNGLVSLIGGAVDGNYKPSKMRK